MSRKVFRRGVTTTSTTLSNLGEIGDKRFVDGKTYRLVYTATTQAAKALLALDSTDASLTSYTVQAVPASTTPVFCVNDTGAALASGTYFWGLVEGPFTVDSTIVDTDVDIITESRLVLNSDKRISSITTVTSDNLVAEVGVAVVAITSVESLVGSKVIYLKASGA